MTAVAFALAWWLGPPGTPGRVDARCGEAAWFWVTARRDVGYVGAFDPAACYFERLHHGEPGRLRFVAVPRLPGRYHCVFWHKGDVVPSLCVVDAKP